MNCAYRVVAPTLLLSCMVCACSLFKRNDPPDPPPPVVPSVLVVTVPEVVTAPVAVVPPTQTVTAAQVPVHVAIGAKSVGTHMSASTNTSTGPASASNAAPVHACGGAFCACCRATWDQRAVPIRMSTVVQRLHHPERGESGRNGSKVRGTAVLVHLGVYAIAGACRCFSRGKRATVWRPCPMNFG